ncbi:MAG: ATP-binding protein [Alphaproteobacteria bacterium]|nr:ATP-binding protein [Alphaproteobacteria bacterium]
MTGSGDITARSFSGQAERCETGTRDPSQGELVVHGEGGLPADIAWRLSEARPAYVADLNGRVTGANARYRRLASLVADPGGRADPARPAFPLEEAIAAVLGTGCCRSHHDMLRGPEGEHHFLSDHFPVHDDNGQISGICGVYEDNTLGVSERKASLVAKERFDDIARLVAGWIWETDADFQLTYVSPQAMDFLGLHPREMLGRSLLTIGRLGEKGPEAATEPFRTGNRTPFRDATFTFALANGTHRYFSLSGLPIFDSEGNFNGYRGMATDITRVTEARRVANMSQGQLTLAIENITEGFALFDASGALVLVNNRFGEYLKEATQALEPGTQFDAVARDAANRGLFASRDEALEAWLSLWPRAKALHEASAEIHAADDRWFRVSGRSTEENGLVVIVSDVTVMKSREETLKASRDIAERASRSKSLFLANMSHELRTPLNAIIGFSELMHDESLGPLGEPRYKEYVEDIIDSSRHLLGVINDILEVSKAEAGKIELFEENLLANDEIKAATRLFTKQADTAGVKLITEPMNPDCTFRADQRKIRQVLLNLISNAIKFTPAGGSVTLTPALRANGEFTITVQDTGIGMAEQDIPAALTPFGQVESTLSRRFEGTGLGLPLSQALMEVHGGRLRLDSAPGQGTRVRITLPKERVVS